MAGHVYGLILCDRVGTPKETREPLLEGETSLNRVRAVARRIKPRMGRKVLFTRDGRELPASALDKEALENWLEAHQPEEEEEEPC